MNTLLKRTSITVACMGIFALMPIQAALINPTLGLPIITFNNNGTIEYNAGTDNFNLNATPFLINQPPVGLVQNGSVAINVKIDDNGEIVSNSSTNTDLVLTGDIVPGGPTGQLLTGRVIDFGFEDEAITDFFDFLFEPTGGELFSSFSGQYVGVEVTSNNHVTNPDIPSFSNLGFTVDFDGEAKGSIGTAPVPEPSTIMLVSIAFVGLFIVGRKSLYKPK